VSGLGVGDDGLGFLARLVDDGVDRRAAAAGRSLKGQLCEACLGLTKHGSYKPSRFPILYLFRDQKFCFFQPK
jgi:hypothetical protein